LNAGRSESSLPTQNDFFCLPSATGLQVHRRILCATIETKHTKLFITCKEIHYPSFDKAESYRNSKSDIERYSEGFIQNNVLKTFLPMVDPQTIYLSKVFVNNIIIFILILGFDNVPEKF
jgi:hypothetical protein